MLPHANTGVRGAEIDSDGRAVLAGSHEGRKKLLGKTDVSKHKEEERSL
jgi:hypothetical protein